MSRLAALLLLAACSSTPPVASHPDSRLGALIFETDAQEFGRINSFAFEGHARFSRRLVAATQTGDRYVLLSLDPARAFGTETTLATQTVFKKVSPTGEVTSLTAPVLGSEVDASKSVLRVAGDGHPYLVELPAPGGASTTLGASSATSWNPVGVILRLHAFDGSAWTTVELLRADRTLADQAAGWDFNEDQVKLTSGASFLVQHGNQLSRFDGAGWRPVTMPPDTKELRLGTADGDQVRAFWLTTDGTLKSDVVKRDGTWGGVVKGLKRGTEPKLAGAWGFSGAVDRFTVQYAVGSQILVLRFEDGAFRQVTQRAPFGEELTGKAYLYGTTHPSRGAFFDNGTLRAFLDGELSGSLGPIPGFSAPATVVCPSLCAVTETHPVASEPDCSSCVPRQVRISSFVLAPDLSAVNLLIADEVQDATMRVYVKSVPLPTALTVVSDVAAATGGFPGEVDGGTPQVDSVTVSGTALLAGAAAHGQTSVALLRAPQQQPLESTITGGDGSFQFSKVPTGTALTVILTQTGYVSQTVTIDATLPGPQLVQRVLSPPYLTAAGFSTSAPESLLWSQGLVQREGTKLTGYDPAAKVYSAALDVGSPVKALVVPDSSSAAVLWMEKGAMKINTSTTVLDPAATFDSVRPLSPFVALASGVPDSATPLSWKVLTGGAQPIALLAQPAVEVAQVGANCSLSLVWTQLAPGDVRASLGSCSTPISITAGTQSAAPIAPMRRLVRAGSFAFGFVGPSCGVESGYQRPCPVQQVSLQGPVTATPLSAGAIDVQTSPSTPLVMLEPAAGVATLKYGAVTVQSGIALPASYGPSETPVTVLNGSPRVLVRTTSGLYSSTGAAGSWTLLASDVVRVVRVPSSSLDSAAYWQAKPGQTSCAQGCSLWLVSKLAAPVSLLAVANGNEQLSDTGVFSDASPWTCPDGSACTLVSFTRYAPGLTTALGAGKLFPDVVANPTMFGRSQDVASYFHLAVMQWPAATVSVLSVP